MRLILVVLSLLMPSISMACDEHEGQHANSAPAPQLTSDNSETDRRPATKDSKDQKDDDKDDQNSARRELFDRPQFSKM